MNVKAVDTINISSPFPTANRELFGMASPVFHRLHSPSRVLRTQHVRWSGGGELPSVQRGTGEGGESEEAGQAGETDGEEAET